MVALITCFACRRGDCKHCEGGRPAPKGVFGGTMCPCEGKCVAQPDPIVDAMVDAYKRINEQEGSARLVVRGC